MAGSSIFDYVHVKDHEELAEQLGLSIPSYHGGTSIPSPSPASDDGSNNNTTSRPVSPPLPEKGEHYGKMYICTVYHHF